MDTPRPLTEHLTDLRARLTLVPRPVDSPACALCQDSGLYTGWVEEASGARTLYGNQPCPAPGCLAGRRVAAEREQARVDQALGDSDIPPRFACATLEDCRQSDGVVERARQAIADRRSLFLWGDYGTGKTYLAVALLRAELARGRAGRFVVVPDLLDLIRRSYGRGDNAADAVLAAVETVDLLVLDDLGTERANDFALETLYKIVNARYLHERQTIVTSNYRGSDLESRGLGRIVSRLVEMSLVLRFAGDDRRLGGL